MNGSCGDFGVGLKITSDRRSNEAQYKINKDYSGCENFVKLFKAC